MTKTGTLDDMYFEWLYASVGAVRNRNPARSYWKLAKQLYTTPFRWSIRNDDNREADGKNLREEFINDWEVQGVDQQWMELDCSMLEMLIALGRRAAFESMGDDSEWFWRLLETLDLRQYNDLVYCDIVSEEIDAVLNRVIDRTYEKNGDGGLFPLTHAARDQRRVELWYQLSAYLLEQGCIDVDA